MNGYPLTRLLSAALLMLAMINAHAKVGARLDSDRIQEGQSFQLIIQTDGELPKRLDLTPLDQDFQRLGTGQSQNIQYINGHMSRSVSLSIELLPKRTGLLSVPSLQIGQQRTPLLRIHVEPLGSSAGSSSNTQGAPRAQPYRVEAALTPAKGRLQQQFIYRVRLLYQGRINKAQMAEPELPADAAIVRSLGQEKHYQSARDGLRYQVVERSYAIFPLKSGELNIPGPLVELLAPPKRAPRRDPFFGRDPFQDLFAQGQVIRLRAPARKLNVQARPDQAQSLPYWLAAQDVQLKWLTPPPKSIHQGDAVNLKLRLRARDMVGELLPNLPLNSNADWKLYADEGETKTSVNAAGALAYRDINVALFAKHSGQIALPEVGVDWWDSKTNTMRRSRLPADTIEVLAAVTDTVAAPTQTADPAAATSAIPAADTPEPDPSRPANTQTTQTSAANPLTGLPLTALIAALIGALIIGLLLGAILTRWAIRRTKPTTHTATATTAPGPSPNSLKTMCKQLSKTQEAIGQRALIQAWLKQHTNKTTPLGTVADEHKDPQLAKLARQLDVAAFSNNAGHQGQGLNEQEQRQLCEQLKRLSAQLATESTQTVSPKGKLALYPP